MQQPLRLGPRVESSGVAANVALERRAGLVLDPCERRIQGVEMAPLLTGELKLLSYLGSRPRSWHSSYSLSLRVYGREDAAARQLVWKYASTLRKKLAKELPDLIELCRRRGYRCRAAVTLFEDPAAGLLAARELGVTSTPSAAVLLAEALVPLRK